MEPSSESLARAPSCGVHDSLPERTALRLQADDGEHAYLTHTRLPWVGCKRKMKFDSFPFHVVDALVRWNEWMNEWNCMLVYEVKSQGRVDDANGGDWHEKAQVSARESGLK